MSKRSGLLRASLIAGCCVLASAGASATLSGEGPARGFLVALEAQTGERQWRFGPARSPQCLRIIFATAERVFVNAQAEGGSLDVFAFDARTGRRVWTTRLSDQPTPAVAQHLVFLRGIPSEPGPTVVADDSRGGFRALDAETGELRWQTRVEGPIPPGQTFARAVGRNVVVVQATSSGEVRPYREFLRGLDRATGEPRWQFDVPTDFSVSVAAVNDGAIALVAMPIRQSAEAQLAGPQVIALDEHTGVVRFQVPLPGRRTESPESPVVMSDSVIVASTATGVTALDASSGEVMWQIDDLRVVGPITNRGTFAGIRGNGNLLVVDARTGERIYTVPGGQATRVVRSGFSVSDLGVHATRRLAIIWEYAGATAFDPRTETKSWNARVRYPALTGQVVHGRVYLSGGCLPI